MQNALSPRASANSTRLESVHSRPSTVQKVERRGHGAAGSVKSGGHHGADVEGRLRFETTIPEIKRRGVLIGMNEWRDKGAPGCEVHWCSPHQPHMPKQPTSFVPGAQHTRVS